MSDNRLLLAGSQPRDVSDIDFMSIALSERGQGSLHPCLIGVSADVVQDDLSGEGGRRNPAYERQCLKPIPVAGIETNVELSARQRGVLSSPVSSMLLSRYTCTITEAGDRS